MHKRVIKISSGGVHNICIVEAHQNSIQEEVFKKLMNSQYTDVVFKGFYSTYSSPSSVQHESFDTYSV